MADSDLFFSYQRADLARAQPLLAALEALGVRVWRDELDLHPGSSITLEIRRSIASSKALLAFYGATYDQSNPCRQELLTAYLNTAKPYERILIYNPENTFKHIPSALRDHQTFSTSEGAESGAAKIAAHVKNLAGPISASVLEPPRFFGMAPQQARNFVGRISHMWQLHACLTANRISIETGVLGQSSVYLCGLAGNGKSLLAREYAIQFSVAYPGGIFWLNGHGNESLDPSERASRRRDQIRSFAIALGLAEQLKSDSPADVEAIFWNCIDVRRLPILWIVDDLPSGLHHHQIEQDWLARLHQPTLFTTRSRAYGNVGAQVDLDTLEPDEAELLLRRHRTPSGDDEERALREITKALGFHPLALDVAGSYLAKGVQNFKEFAADLATPGSRAIEYGAKLKQDLPTGHERSITKTLLKSIDGLGEEGLHYLEIASLLATEPISNDLMQSLWVQLFPTDQQPEAVLEAFDQIDTLSLCERDGSEARRVHSLVSRTIQLYKKSDDEPRRRAWIAYKLAERLQNIGDVSAHQGLANDIAHAREIVRRQAGSPHEANLASYVATYDFEIGDFTSARRLQKEVVHEFKQLFGANSRETLRAILSLGKIDAQAGNLKKAKATQENVLRELNRYWGSTDPDTLAAQHGLAATLRSLGQFQEARSLLEQILPNVKGRFGPEHQQTIAVLNDLAGVLSDLGLHAQSNDLMQTILQMPNDSPEEKTATLNNYALVLRRLGRLDEACKLQEQVLEEERALFGESHLKTLTAATNLGQTLHRLDKLQEARELQEKTLAAAQSSLGKKHPLTLAAMNNLATTLKALGEKEIAVNWLREAVDAANSVLGTEHPSTLTAMLNLSSMLSPENSQEAGRLAEIVLQKRRQILGPSHPEIFAAMNGLAAIFVRNGQLDEAEALGKEAYAGLRATYGEEHPDTQAVKRNLDLIPKMRAVLRKLRLS